MDNAQEETIKSSSSSSSTSSTSLCPEDKSQESIPSERTSQCSDSNPSERSDRDDAKAQPPDSQSQKPAQPNEAGASSRKKGSVGCGAVPRAPQPPKRQKSREVRRNPALNDANLKRLASQELHIKCLNNLIIELQNENEAIKVENRTLRQVQARLQHKTREEKTLDEVTAQHVQDTHVLNEQLKRYKKQMRAAEKMIKDKDERIAKLQSEMKKNEESLTHMKELLAQKGLEGRDELLREIDRQKRLAQDADEKAADVARNAEEINNLHQKILLAEKRRTEEATMKVIYLLKTVQDLNRRLMIEEMVQRNMKIYAKVKAEREAETTGNA